MRKLHIGHFPGSGSGRVISLVGDDGTALLVQDFVWDTGTQVHATYAVDPGYLDSWSLTF
ncbi:hypothetical protein [Streptomyces sp. NBC_01483]|uniref:hypothetical protein n=1 Tax=Streptomyces sp. NBC_01483 TaxID=2903883 RepID=UPI002E36FE5B|nr:hypothetical protein [Streptomyces sp. NBC_01483]